MKKVFRVRALVLVQQESKGPGRKMSEDACTFCKKTRKEVRRLKANKDGSAKICDECLEFCLKIIEEVGKKSSREKHKDGAHCHFCKTDKGLIIQGCQSMICHDCVKKLTSEAVAARKKVVNQ